MLEIDGNEPPAGMQIISPVVPAQISQLNVDGWGDYRWYSEAAKRWTNVERKTWPEILANVDKVEDQLRKHQERHPTARLLFIMEGWAAETAMGTALVVQAGYKQGVWVLGHQSGTRMSRIYSWLYAASEYVEVFQTGNYNQTCQMLVAAYKQDMKEEEEKKIFHRHFKEVAFHPNPQVLKIMSIEPGIGEKKAEAIVEKFPTLWHLINADVKELETVPGMGPILSKRLLQRAGRIDV